MYYAVSIKKIKKVASVTLLLAAAVIIFRFWVLPKMLYPQKYSEYVDRYSQEYGLDDTLVYAVIKAESNFDPNALSHRGAIGLMQITEQTGKWGAEELGILDFDVQDLFQPETNIHIGCWYLNKLMHQYKEPLETALAAYNAGSGNVSKWLQNLEYSEDGVTLSRIPFPETEKYVKKIRFNIKMYDLLYD